MSIQLTYRGHSYNAPVAAMPIVKSELKLTTTYRGVPTTVQQYQFQVAKPDHLNWRTMRFMGKRYVATATPTFGLV